ncbi:ABC transporter substrate-binding protein [Pseudonocardia broussonetiae]|uniref:Thiamine pyrimidine synthase n=1 Tax=Pseudonocardia broussonetiae TaxID=2736640 RepID=A0A6M6JHK8_9PSEU|nr:ABC transporter substrate-binding protein [Pseudonocardia broussonetiae]QJY46926.1 ABC transporter substrate-binding protein [Pseudonocardia broussonetiae]
MIVSRRDVLRLSGLGAAGLVLSACGGGSTTPAPAAAGAAGSFGNLSVQLSWIKNIEFGGEYMADSKGYYTEAGFDAVELVSGPVDSADALVLAGNVDVGISAPDATARFIVEQGAPLKIIGNTFQKNPFCILSIEEGAPIRTVADLAGKRIGIQAGTNQQIFAGLLAANGIDPASLEQVVVQYEPTPLTEKTVDGFMSFLTNEPFLVKADGFTPVTLAFADNGLPLTSESFVVLQETIDSERDKLKAFLLAEIKGWNDAVADPAAAAELAVTTYGADLGLDVPGQTEQATAQNDLIVSADTKANGLFTATDAAITDVIGALAAIGITITAEELFDFSLLDEVYAENPDLIVG